MVLLCHVFPKKDRYNKTLQVGQRWSKHTPWGEVIYPQVGISSGCEFGAKTLGGLLYGLIIFTKGKAKEVFGEMFVFI